MEKEIYIVDLKPFIELQSSLGIANNNINQIARWVNKTGVIYKTDIKEIKDDIAKIAVGYTFFITEENKGIK